MMDIIEKKYFSVAGQCLYITMKINLRFYLLLLPTTYIYLCVHLVLAWKYKTRLNLKLYLFFTHILLTSLRHWYLFHLWELAALGVEISDLYNELPTVRVSHILPIQTRGYYFLPKAIHTHKPPNHKQACDNIKAIQKIKKSHPNPTRLLDPEVDIILAIWALLSKTPTSSAMKWMKGHTDDKIPYDDLDPEKQNSSRHGPFGQVSQD
jgi:hypothetical protein